VISDTEVSVYVYINHAVHQRVISDKLTILVYREQKGFGLE